MITRLSVFRDIQRGNDLVVRVTDRRITLDRDALPSDLQAPGTAEILSHHVDLNDCSQLPRLR